MLVGGAALQWLRDGLGVIETAAESERLATSVDSTGGVHFVPALTGLGSPQWRPDARGLISGITRGTTRAHLVRAALEAIAHQVADVLEALPLDVSVLRADGGATANRFLMQLQADLIGSRVEVAADAEATALGAAALAGLAVGTWSGADELASLLRRGERYEPDWGQRKWSVIARNGETRFGACSCDALLRAVPGFSLNLESSTRRSSATETWMCSMTSCGRKIILSSRV